MNICFIGCVESSQILLEELIKNNIKISGVITKSSSKFNSDFVDLGELCGFNEIPYIYQNNANSEESIKFLKDKNPDLILCCGWSGLLNEEVINISKRGVVGFHPTALPNNKGRHPIAWTLVLGLKKTASTFFMIDTGVDSGDIISQVEIEVCFDDDARTLYDKIMKAARKQIIELISQFENNHVVYKRTSQIGNVWRKRTKQDGLIDWRMSTIAIYNLVRGLTRPYIGAHFLNNGIEYKVWKVEVEDKDYLENIEPGKILKVYSPTEFIIKVSNGTVHIKECDPISLKEGDYI